jgi:hypothetical protein
MLTDLKTYLEPVRIGKLEDDDDDDNNNNKNNNNNKPDRRRQKNITSNI